MNLKLEKIKRKKLIDYSAFSGYIRSINGQLIFKQGIRNVIKLTSNKKLSHNEEFERKIQFLAIIRHFNNAFHKKSNQNNSIDCKPKTCRIFFPSSNQSNNIIHKNRTMIDFYKNKKIMKNPFRIKSCINSSNKNRCSSMNSICRLNKRKKLDNEKKYKEIYEQFQKIKKLINKENSSINNDNGQSKSKLIKNKSAYNLINGYSQNKNDNVRLIKNSPNKNKIKLEKNKELFKQISFYSNKSCFNRYKNYESNKNNSISYVNEENKNKDYISKAKNKFKTIEDKSNIDLKIFKEYDFNPSKTFIELKDYYNFIECNNSKNNHQTVRYKYLMKLRNVFNKNQGMKLLRDIIPSEKRIKIIKRHLI